MPAIPWFYPKVGERDSAAVAKVIASNYINDGKVARELERTIADRIGVKYCVAVTSGTAAISLAVMGLGIGPGDEVIVPDLTFIATANAVRLAGATVKLVDVEPRRFTIDVEKTAAAIGPRTKAIVPVDVNGRGADYEALEKLCSQCGLKLICDAAEAFGSMYFDRPLGAFGNAGCFSFSANKTVTSGQGGMIATNSEALHLRLRELKDQGRREVGTGGDDVHPVMGFNFKYTNLQAALALSQMDLLDERLEHFRRRDAWYRDFLADCSSIVIPSLSNNPGEVPQWTDILCDNRNAINTELRSQGIDSRPFWIPLHRQEPYRASDCSFENSVEISNRGLWLPSSFDLTREDAWTVSNAIREVVGRSRE